MPERLRRLRPDEPVVVAIPTKNRPTYLAALLTSLLYQSYPHWALVVNDSSDPPVAEVPAVADLLVLIRSTGHEVVMVHSETGWDRHQRAMAAAPAGVELLVRVDDDVILTPTYLEAVLKPFHLFPARPLAAVGGCVPEGHYSAVDLDVQLQQPGWLPTATEPAWRLQGHWYFQDEVLEVDSLFGHSIAYRRSAVEAVGGWAVPGYSQHAFREESDLCMRLRAARYDIMVTTAALAWHLYAPGGGSRTVRKTAQGNFLDEADQAATAPDEVLFRQRQQGLDLPPATGLHRYRLRDLEQGRWRPRPMQSWVGRLKHRRHAFLRRVKQELLNLTYRKVQTRLQDGPTSQ